MKLLKLSIVMGTILVAGCATNSDVEALQGQINILKTDVSTARNAANSANISANDAASRAAAAEFSANRAATSADEVSRKFDAMFKRSMYK